MFTLVRQLPFEKAKHKSVNPPSTSMMKITTTRVTSTVVLTGQLVHVDGELLVDEPAE